MNKRRVGKKTILINDIRLQWFVMAICFIIPVFACDSGDGTQTPLDAAREIQMAAEEGLGEFQAEITPENKKQYGFDETDDPGKATLADPLVIHELPQTALSDYQEGTGYEPLLAETETHYFPVEIQDDPKSILVVQ